MRVLVISKDKHPVPIEQFPALMQAFKDWRERYRSKMEAFFFFAGSTGGGGIANVADEAELSQMMLEYPFYMYSDLEIRPILDGDVALEQWQMMMQSMMAAAPQ